MGKVLWKIGPHIFGFFYLGLVFFICQRGKKGGVLPHLCGGGVSGERFGGGRRRSLLGFPTP